MFKINFEETFIWSVQILRRLLDILHYDDVTEISIWTSDYSEPNVKVTYMFIMGAFFLPASNRIESHRISADRFRPLRFSPAIKNDACS